MAVLYVPYSRGSLMRSGLIIEQGRGCRVLTQEILAVTVL